MSYSPLFHEITDNAVVIDICFKNLNFKKSLLVLTMFIQRADGLVKLMGTRIVFAIWDHAVQ